MLAQVGRAIPICQWLSVHNMYSNKYIFRLIIGGQGWFHTWVCTGCLRTVQNFKLHKGMFPLLIARCQLVLWSPSYEVVSVPSKYAVFGKYLCGYRGKNDACRPKLQCKNAKKGRLLTHEKEGRLADSGGRWSIIAGGQVLVACSTYKSKRKRWRFI